ncbi:MAG: hypothetical protein AMXMBFR77_00370 [Phycisphaerales bacterium]
MGGVAQVRWGPDNPHPLSTMKTELVWEGKYDEWGNRRTVDAASLAMPMQKIETIDQPRSEAIASGKFALFEKQSKRADDFRNRLIWGDNKLVMASLLAEFKGKVDLIYIDPPFDVGADFSLPVPIGEEDDEFVHKDASALEMVAYRDTWGRGPDSYLSMLSTRLEFCHNLLADTGSICVHCDWRLNSPIRMTLEEIFGADSFINEIVWRYGKMSNATQRFPRNHDTILAFGKTCGYRFSPIKTAPSEYRARYERILKENKVYYGSVRSSTDRLVLGRIKKVAKDLGRDLVDDDVLFDFDAEFKTQDDVFYDISIVKGNAGEQLDYPTQKPEALIKRLLEAFCPKDGLVADFFCGSGTTGAVAEKLGRRWIMCDLGRFAIHTTRKRMIEVQRQLHAEGKPYRAFDLYNLGRYERQWWQQEALKGADEEHRRVVLEFFRAEMLEAGKASHPLIHGRKGRALCHVNGIDGIFTAAEAREVAKAAAAMGAKELCCLAWDFEMNIHQRLEAIRAEMGIDIRIYRIPREIMEKNRKGPPPWLEVAVLEAEPVYRAPAEKGGPAPVDIRLTRFLPSLAEVPTKELEAIRERAIRSGFDFIDFWAVDFEWREDKPFNHHWQDYRTRKDRSLKTVSDAGHVYAKKGEYTACVKVVDVFGCDTSITVKVRV